MASFATTTKKFYASADKTMNDENKMPPLECTISACSLFIQSPSQDTIPWGQPGVHLPHPNKCVGEPRVKPGIWGPEMWAQLISKTHCPPTWWLNQTVDILNINGA
jgi:hypothetical protein